MAEASVLEESQWQSATPQSVDQQRGYQQPYDEGRINRKHHSKPRVHSKHHHHHHHHHKSRESRNSSSTISKEQKVCMAESSNDGTSTNDINKFPGGTFTTALKTQADMTGPDTDKHFTIIDVPDRPGQVRVQNYVEELITNTRQPHYGNSSGVNSSNFAKSDVSDSHETCNSNTQSARYQFNSQFAENLDKKCSISDLDDNEEDQLLQNYTNKDVYDPTGDTLSTLTPDSEIPADQFENKTTIGESSAVGNVPGPSTVIPPPPELPSEQIYHEVEKDNWQLIRLLIAKKKLKSTANSHHYMDGDDKQFTPKKQNKAKHVDVQNTQTSPVIPPAPPMLPPNSLWNVLGRDMKLLTAILKAKSKLRPLTEKIDKASEEVSTPDIQVQRPNDGQIQPIVDDDALLKQIDCALQSKNARDSAPSKVVTTLLTAPPPPCLPPKSFWNTVRTNSKFLTALLIAKRNLRPVQRTRGGFNLLIQPTQDVNLKMTDCSLTDTNVAESGSQESRSQNIVTRVPRLDNVDSIPSGNIKSWQIFPEDLPEIYIQQPSDGQIKQVVESDVLLKQIDCVLEEKIGTNQRNIETKNGPCHHFTKNGRYLYELYKHDQLTDLVVEVGQYTFNTHAAVLSCHSEYIANLVKKKTVRRVKLDTEVSPASLQVVLQYMYTGDLEINGDNASEVLECSATLKIPDVASRCDAFLNQMAPEDLLQVVQMALQGGVKEATLAKQWEIISSNFCTIVESTKFLNMDVNTVCALVSRDDISVHSEMDVAQAVFRWLSYTDERQQHAQRAMSHVRFLLMTSQDIVTIVARFKHVMMNAALKQAVLESLWYVTSIENDLDLHVVEVDMPKQRCGIQLRKDNEPPTRTSSSSDRKVSISNLKIETDEKGVTRISAHDLQTLYGTTSSTETDQKGETDSPEEDKAISAPCIFLVGGFGSDFENMAQDGRSVEHYDINEDRWQPFAMIPEPKHKHCAVIQNGYIYVTGGSSSSPMAEQKPTNDVYRLNITTATWDMLRPMKSERMYHVSVAMSGKIFAIGGQSKDDQILPNSEYYNPAKDIWFKACPPRYSRMAAAATVYDNKIFLAGGYGYETCKKVKTTEREVLNTVEYYDHKAKSWTVVCPLPYPKTNSRLAVLDESLYSFGGLCPSCDGPVNTFEHAMFVDLYDSKSDTWTSVTTLMSPRCDSGIAVINSQLYIMGGMDLKDIMGVDTVERYDAKSGEWTTMSPLPSIRSGPQCVAYTTD